MANKAGGELLFSQKCKYEQRDSNESFKVHLAINSEKGIEIKK